jgi:hypothetical protein
MFCTSNSFERGPELITIIKYAIISNAVYFAALTRQLLARFTPFQQNLNIPPATLAATFTNMERRVGLYLQVEGNHFRYLLQTHYLPLCPRKISFHG